MTAPPPAGDAEVVHVAPGDASPEVVADALWQLGATAVEHRERLLVAGFADADDLRAAARALTARFAVSIVSVDGWADVWRSHEAVTSVAGIAIGPSRLLPRPGPDQVVIDAGRSFGSGAHVTTRLAVELLAGLDLAGRRVLDVGTGSGVLGIVAAVRGATRVRMLDIDAAAVIAAQANVAANGVADRCDVLHRGPAPGDGPVEVVAANLLCADHLTVAAVVHEALASPGNAVVSGVLVDQFDTVVAAHPGWRVARHLAVDGWAAAVLVS